MYKLLLTDLQHKKSYEGSSFSICYSIYQLLCLYARDACSLNRVGSWQLVVHFSLIYFPVKMHPTLGIKVYLARDLVLNCAI